MSHCLSICAFGKKDVPSSTVTSSRKDNTFVQIFSVGVKIICCVGVSVIETIVGIGVDVKII